MSGKRHGKRRAFVALSTFFLAPAIMYLLEERRRRRQTVRPGPRPDPAPGVSRAEPAGREAPPVSITPPPEAVERPTRSRRPAWRRRSAPLEPEAAPEETHPRPRATRLRLGFIVGAVALVVVVPTSLYVALSSFSLPQYPWGSSSGSSKSSRAGRLIGRESGGLKVVSYYPPEAGWSYMWTRYDGERIAADFQRAHSLGFDTIRIFVPPSAFGFPHPTSVMQSRLRDLIATAASAKLHVGLSLFDRFEHYDDRAGSATWLRAILVPYADDERIAFVEVHNEINPANPRATSWLAAMIHVARREAPRMPLVASVSGGKGVPGLKALARSLAGARPDVYSLHYYSNPAYLEATLRRAQHAVAPVALILGEVGYSTAADNRALEGAPRTTWAQEAEQSIVLRSAFAATRQLALPAPGIWTLYDFQPGAFPPGIAQGNRSEQQAFGLLHVDGTPKPAAEDVRNYLTKSIISTGINTDFARGGPGPTGPQPTYWRQFDGRDGTLTWDAATGHDAPGSARLTATKGTSKRVPAYFQHIWSIEVRPHQDFRLVAWARGLRIRGDDRIGVSWFDANGKYLGQKQSPRLTAGNPGWTRLEVTAQPPAGAVAVEVHLKSAHETGIVWFDDVGIE